MEIGRRQSSYTYELIFFLILLFVLVINLFSFSSNIRSVLSFIFAPIHYLSESAGTNVNEIFESIGSISTLKDENREIKVNLVKLESENQMIALILEENEALKDQLELGIGEVDLLEASIISDNVGGVQDHLFINVGAEDGVEVGDTVVIGNFFIGTISSVEKQSSRVLLPTNTTNFLQVFITESEFEGKSVDQLKKDFGNENSAIRKEIGVSVGSASGVLIENISNSAEVNIGDAVFINDQKVNQILYLGEIGEVINNPSASQKNAIVKTPLQYDQLNYVFVVIDNE